MAAADKALIRTVAFTEDGSVVSRSIQVFNRPVQLTFAPRGRNFWVYPDGKVEMIAGD